MKVAFMISAIIGIAVATPVFAAPVTMTFKNASTTTDMKVFSINTCNALSPTPAAVPFGKTSFASSTNCGSAASAATVTYFMGTKYCRFQIATIYTPGNIFFGTSGYWTGSSSATASGGAICKVDSKDVSKLFSTGAYSAVFSMK